ncbi:MutS-related protein [Sphingobacterium pedocola]|uniref:DNA mismatch repair protein MutS n=1 Tax=Sphingobacterium pedocola TaxID=2082722 RepID=A0ABR9T499_9SPHI|nr:DNA mismatch repair protein MutS [Sphingobacterium pedocola]MBE8719724.1 DNA mismatch repair protein MutS [Sphingobacterium pedocola]
MKEFYNRNITTTEAELVVIEKRVNTNSLFRLAVILLGGTILFKIFQLNNVLLLFVVVITILLLFSYLILRQSKLEKKREDKRAFLRVNKNEIDLLQGHVNIYSNGEQFEDGKHPYISDLDVFGPHSLFEKINRSATPDGVERLASWFLKSANKEIICSRQRASAEITEKKNWAQQLQTKLLFNLGQKTNIKVFLTKYLGDESLNFGSSFMKGYVSIAPLLFLIGGSVSIFLYPIWGYLAILGLVHLCWSMALGGKVSHFSSRIDKIGTTLVAYSDAIQLVENEEFTADLNVQLQEELKTDNAEKKLSQAFRELGKLIDKLDARNNILVGAILNIIFLWDFRQVLSIVKWKKNYEGNIVHAFDVIADFEALLGLSTLQRNESDWSTPVILDNYLEDGMNAEGINHPLIPVHQAVANNYDAKVHRVALVTGSNMAGKSTFLRTVGVNAVLAYAGAVVCAKQFRLPIYRLVTYMRIKDSLNESTSTFKAELDRVKFILGIVEVADDSFFLIDEMLRGTNSVDKYLGSRAIIKKLIAMNGRGMVATHDLQLATLEDEYPSILQNYHFDIQIKEGEMLFDYKLKDGQCTVFNASLLLKGIGIDVDSSNFI